MYRNLLGLLFKHRSDSVLLGWSLRFYMASKLLGDIHATGQGPHFECQGQRKRPKDYFLTFHAYMQAAVVQKKVPQLLIRSKLKVRSRQQKLTTMPGFGQPLHSWAESGPLFAFVLSAS